MPKLKKSAKTELQNTMKVRTTATHINESSLQLQDRISTPKRKNDDLETLFQENLQRKTINATMGKICCQSTISNCPAAITIQFTTPSCRAQKITRAAAAGRNLDCRTHRLDAAVPTHEVSQRMQNTIAQHQQRREKSPGTISYTARAIRARCHGKPSRKRANFSPQPNLRLPEKNAMFRANPSSQIASLR